VAGEIAENVGTPAALLLPMIAAFIAFAAGVANWLLSGERRRGALVKP
jgi:hypothetical protein